MTLENDCTKRAVIVVDAIPAAEPDDCDRLLYCIVVMIIRYWWYSIDDVVRYCCYCYCDLMIWYLMSDAIVVGNLVLWERPWLPRNQSRPIASLALYYLTLKVQCIIDIVVFIIVKVAKLDMTFASVGCWYCCWLLTLLFYTFAIYLLLLMTQGIDGDLIVIHANHLLTKLLLIDPVAKFLHTFPWEYWWLLLMYVIERPQKAVLTMQRYRCDGSQCCRPDTFVALVEGKSPLVTVFIVPWVTVLILSIVTFDIDIDYYQCYVLLRGRPGEGNLVRATVG